MLLMIIPLKLLVVELHQTTLDDDVNRRWAFELVQKFGTRKFRVPSVRLDALTKPSKQMPGPDGGDLDLVKADVW